MSANPSVPQTTSTAPAQSSETQKTCPVEKTDAPKDAAQPNKECPASICPSKRWSTWILGSIVLAGAVATLGFFLRKKQH